MQELLTLNDIDAVLTAYIPAVHETTGKDITLGRMRQIMEALNNPEKNLKIIHIAGTSGKTSTTYYITALLKTAGKKVGMTVSPHIDSVTERLQVNMIPVEPAEFGNALVECIEQIEKANIKPTYFELLIALAYWFFARIKVDYAVIETGLGGLHDGTNVAERSDKLCVITDIGFDHMQILGNTLTEIAAQKAGIIHPGNTVVMYRQTDEVMQVFKKRCDETGAELCVIDPNMTLSAEVESALKALPKFQQRNWKLAYEALKNYADKNILNMLSMEQLSGTMNVQVPARMDIVKINNKPLVMDGAHNDQKMEAFISSFKKQFPGKKAAVLLSLKQDKKFKEVLPILKDVSDKLIITTFSSLQDRPAQSTDPYELAKTAEAAGFKDVIVEVDQGKAYDLLLNTPEEVRIITGSFYLIGQLRQKREELIHA